MLKLLVEGCITDWADLFTPHIRLKEQGSSLAGAAGLPREELSGGAIMLIVGKWAPSTLRKYETVGDFLLRPEEP